MCIALAGLGNLCPTHAELTRACEANPDGFGYAIVVDSVHGRTLLTERTMSAKAAIRGFLGDLATHGELVVAWTFHARIATHGSVNVQNCHPFTVGDDPLTVIAHNGILPLATDRDRSDSRVFAEDVLPRFGGVAVFDDDVLCSILDGWVENSGSKVVILTAAPTEFPLVILNESAGHWNETWWASNRSYEDRKSWTTYGTYPSTIRQSTQAFVDADDDVVEDKCVNPLCDNYPTTYEDRCDWCNTCQACEFDAWVCECYVGPNHSLVAR